MSDFINNNRPLFVKPATLGTTAPTGNSGAVNAASVSNTSSPVTPFESKPVELNHFGALNAASLNMDATMRAITEHPAMKALEKMNGRILDDTRVASGVSEALLAKFAGEPRIDGIA
jgi:hypothetical protein